MNNSRSILALDVGDRRIGVAIASMEARIASPLFTIDRQKVGDIFLHINQIIKEHEVSILVVGLPRGMEGQETIQTKSVREFAEKLEKITGISTHMQDEAATSLLAKDELERKNKPYQKGDVDMLAATYILSDWLESQAVKI
jgi:putative holliday junction resolvase